VNAANPRQQRPARGASRRPRARFALAALLALALAGAVAACGASTSANGGKIALVAYSTPEKAYDALIPAFQKTPEGKGASFTTSFGASGDQSRAVEAGQPADVVEFSLEPDMQRLVDAGIVPADWNQNRYHGFVTDSVVTFIVRKGNPKGIHTWDDLVKPGVEVIVPNPFQSGGARWDIMAAYGAQLNEGKSPAQAQAYLKELFQHVPVQPASANDALSAFTNGKGDVLLDYENDALEAQAAGASVDYVIPDDTIKIENPIATTKDAPQQAKDFVKFLYTPEAQQIFADQGYRPVVPSVFQRNADRFPTPPGLFTIDDLGGWDKVSTEFFDPENGIVAGIERDLGVATQ